MFDRTAGAVALHGAAGSGVAPGGTVGLAGPLSTIWCGLRGWPADEQRGVYQPYSLVILSLTLLLYCVQGMVTRDSLWLATACVPVTMLGVYAGVRLYGRVEERQFRRLVLWLLLLSGVVLVASNFW